MALERGWWDKPVPVTLRGISSVTNINNSVQAADILLNRWPVAGGAKHLAARKAVLSAMRKALDANAQAKARKAFAEAAREADILAADESRDDRA